MQALMTDTSPQDLDDASLAQRVANGDLQAFELVMRRHNRRLYRLARATLRNDAEAEDALQEAYIAAFRSMASYRRDATLATWLSRLVLNECFSRLRREKRRHNIAPMHGSDFLEGEAAVMTSDKPSGPDRDMERSQMRGILERRLDQLPDDFRVVFVLRSVEELSVEETARCLGIAEGTVRSRHFRARSLLREALARHIDIAESEVFGFGGEHCDRVVAAVLRRLGEAGAP